MEPNTPSAVMPAPANAGPPELPTWPRVPRSLSAGRGLDWWGEGWRVFMAAPLLWIGIVVILLVVFAALAFVPLLGNLAQGVLWPVFAGGLFLGCHALARGRSLEIAHLFAGFQEGRAGGLIVLGLISLAVGAVLFIVIALFVFGAVGVSGVAGMMSSDPAVAMGSAIAGAGVAALIAMPIVLIAFLLFLMAWWFATPLVALNRARPVEALKASFDAAWKNLGALALFVLIYMLLAIVASIPFGLGWLVLGPVAMGANYASWREVFGE
jgi:uncharacterized membrane protein